jgi:hypothetical protein
VGQALAKLDYERIEKRNAPGRFVYRKIMEASKIQHVSPVDKYVDNSQSMPI